MFWWFYLGALGVMGIITFVTYGVDKRQARRDGQRVSERTLHMLELSGGWLGALAGAKLFRHKTRKRSYVLVRRLIVAAHLLALGAAALKHFDVW